MNHDTLAFAERALSPVAEHRRARFAQSHTIATRPQKAWPNSPDGTIAAGGAHYLSREILIHQATELALLFPALVKQLSRAKKPLINVTLQLLPCTPVTLLILFASAASKASAASSGAADGIIHEFHEALGRSPDMAVAVAAIKVRIPSKTCDP